MSETVEIEFTGTELAMLEFSASMAEEQVEQTAILNQDFNPSQMRDNLSSVLDKIEEAKEKAGIE